MTYLWIPLLWIPLWPYLTDPKSQKIEIFINVSVVGYVVFSGVLGCLVRGEQRAPEIRAFRKGPAFHESRVTGR